MWNIERIVCADGQPDNSGILLSKNQFYGCADRFGGFESFYPITIASLKLFQSVIHLPSLGEKEIAHLHPQDKNLKYSFKVVVRTTHRNNCRYQRAWSKRKIINERKYQDRRFGPLLMVSNYGSCTIAALVNAIVAKCGRDLAMRSMIRWKKECPRVRSLKNISLLLHGLEMNLSVEKVPRKENEEFKKDPFKWIAERTEGIWIVRVVQDGIFDHVIAIDGVRLLVLDSASRYPFCLCVEILQQVGGSEALHPRIAEVRRLVQQTRNTRKRRRVS